MSCPYNSRDTLYKSVFGASAAECGVRFSVLLPRSFSCSGVRFVVHKDGQSPQKIDLSWGSVTEDGGEERWIIDYRFPSAGLYFYHFEYNTPYGTGKIYLKSAGVGEYMPSGDEWQQTVYDASLKTPDWIKGGIMYQIFPDRFFSSGNEKINVPKDRIIHESCDEPLIWKPNEFGEILNNDYYGGDLDGITQKLPYLKSLSVTAIYLNPIFEAHSNHRYNTADYTRIDPLLGNEDSLRKLCDKAKKLGIAVILDGVFSHTGSDSIYFNRNKRYGSGGAYNDKQSPFRSWYTFKDDGSYKCWWDIKTLPEIKETDSSYVEFITGRDGVLKKWLSCGVRGWRLDVADELPDSFLDALYTSVKNESADNLIIGEVWEDASNKISYGQRRRYLLGGQLDSVMNYPFADAIVRFMRYGGAEELMESIVSICENYPPQILNSLMNHIGTHDTARILTRLVNDQIENKPHPLQASFSLSEEEHKNGRELLKTVAVLQYMLPGFPCLYYGDEAGMSGGGDPFNRACYPWNNEDEELISHYRHLGQIRASLPCLKEGSLIPVSAMLGCIAFARECSKSSTGVLTIINRNNHEIDYYLPERYRFSQELLTGNDCREYVKVPKTGAAVVKLKVEN